MYGWLAIYTDLLTLSFISPCFCLIKETNECYFLRFTQHKVSSNVNDKVFQILLKKKKLFTWEVQFLVDQRRTLAHQPLTLIWVVGCTFHFVEIFPFVEIQFLYCLYLQKDLKRFNLNLILLSNVEQKHFHTPRLKI